MSRTMFLDHVKRHVTVGPEAREYPRLNSPLTKKSLLQENPTVLSEKPAVLSDSISKNVMTSSHVIWIPWIPNQVVRDPRESKGPRGIQCTKSSI